MIKFFRKIRQKLLAENRFSKYLIYAIGEIVLVVIGILIALQINNWNKNRIDYSKQQKYLIGLKNDLEGQITAFKARVLFYDQIIHIGETLLENFSVNGSLIKIDSINSKLSKMLYSLQYPDIKTTFTELNTTGQINLIKKESLRSNVIKYYQNSEDSKLSLNNNITEVHYSHIFPFIKNSIIILPENFNMQSEKVNKKLITTQLSSVFKNNLNNSSKQFEIINAVNLRIIVARTNKSIIVNDKNKAEILLQLIKKE